MKLNKKVIYSSLIALFYAGILGGLLSPSLAPLFLGLLPFHLLLMLIFIILSHHGKNKEFKIFFLFTFLGGFLIEVLGVNTGYIFGTYQFGETLGIRLADVPIVMGALWLILLYSTGVSIAYLKIQNHAIRALIGAFFLVFMDILIEPVAVRLDFWSWENMSIPFQNYVAWFVFSFCMMLFLFARKFRKQNPAALVLLISQLVFFLVLNIYA